MSRPGDAPDPGGVQDDLLGDFVTSPHALPAYFGGIGHPRNPYTASRAPMSHAQLARDVPALLPYMCAQPSGPPLGSGAFPASFDRHKR